MLALLSLYKICEWSSEAMWFESLGYGAQFWRLFEWRAGTFVGAAALFALWLGVNAQIAWRNAASRAVPLSFFQNDDSARLIPLDDKFRLDRYRRRATITLIALLSGGVGAGASARYLLLVRAFSTVGTGQRDNASNFDLAYFLFALPFYQWLSRVALGAIVTALLLVTAIYLYEETLGARDETGFERDAEPNLAARASSLVTSPVTSPAARHIAVLWSMLLLWKGLDCLLSVPRSFVSGGNVAARVFDPVDIRLGWTSAAIFALSAPLIALLSGVSIARKPRLRAFGGGALWMICAGAIPFFLPIIVGRNPTNKDWTNALSRHIGSTRRAWGLESTARRGFVLAPEAPFRAVSTRDVYDTSVYDTSVASSANLAPNNGNLDSNPATVALSSPLALWPAESAKNALNARLAARGARFRVSRVFLERAGDSLRYVGLAAPRIAGGEAGWRTRHERAPRGLFVQMEAARIAPGGAPIFLPDRVVPALIGAVPISGNAANDAARDASNTPTRTALLPDSASSQSTFPGDFSPWIFLSTTAEAVPAGEDSTPRGGGLRGVSLRTLRARLTLGARFFEPQLARSEAGDQITWHRGAAERCQIIAPFLDWRSNEARPVMIADSALSNSTSNSSEATKNEASRLFYLVPGLVWSDDYPDSATPAAPGTAPPGANYGRHIALGVVDAQSGAVSLYTLDEDEPFMALYNRAFPGLFAPPTALPGPVRAALRPSPAILRAQTLIWSRYHQETGAREAILWAAQGDNYRPLLGADEDGFPLRPLAGSGEADWLCIAYARPEGQANAGAVAPLVAMLGADERDFGARGARVKFVEWKARAPLSLPTILVEPTLEIVANRPAFPPPTLLGLAPRFDANGNAIGLIATRAEARIEPATTEGASGETREKKPTETTTETRTEKTTTTRTGAPSVPQTRLTVALQISGVAKMESLEKSVRQDDDNRNSTLNAPANSALNSASARQIEDARAAWRAVQIARKNGDWEAVARAEKRLGDALAENGAKTNRRGATGTQ